MRLKLFKENLTLSRVAVFFVKALRTDLSMKLYHGCTVIFSFGFKMFYHCASRAAFAEFFHHSKSAEIENTVLLRWENSARCGRRIVNKGNCMDSRVVNRVEFFLEALFFDKNSLSDITSFFGEIVIGFYSNCLIPLYYRKE